VEFFWAILAKMLGYAQYSHDFLMTGIFGIFAIPLFYLIEKDFST